MKVIINGALGRLGKAITEVLKTSEGDEIVALVDKNASDCDAAFNSLDEYTGSADVIIDASHHTATESLIKYAYKKSIPCVIATTGHTEDELETIRQSAKIMPVFKAANMSIGVALLCEFAKYAAKNLPHADIEIIETHHVNKLDAPSGTALMIADSIKEVRPDANTVCGRSGQKLRDKNDIGISSVRLSNVVGIHEVVISDGMETITLKHEAHSREMLAQGAIASARFMVGKPNGYYSVDDMIKFG